MKLFRKSRRKIIDQNSKGGFKKYLKYAVGEIVLVMIGILLALAINNWNQNRIAQNIDRKVAENVLKQLKLDLSEIKTQLKFMDENEKFFELYLYDKDLTAAEKLEKCDFMPYRVTMGMTTLNMEDNVLEVLKDRKNAIEVYKTVFDEIDATYRFGLKSLRMNEGFVINELVTNITYLKNNYDWYYKLISGQDLDMEEYEYFESADFRNRVANLYLMIYDGYETDILKMEHEVTQLIKDLETIEE